MRVLFVSSGKKGSTSYVVKNQGESLVKAGISLDYFTISPGLSGYIKSIFTLRKKFKEGNYDIVHAHYSLSGFVAAFSGCKPLVVSLMGSDVLGSEYKRIIIRFFCKYIWDATIVKTRQMKELINLNKIEVIPNGVDIERHKPMGKFKARRHLSIPDNFKVILFPADPSRHEKNYMLAKKTVELLNKAGNNEYILKSVCNVPNEEMPYYYNSADITLVTSKREGSANVIKEAMACNRPVVSTDVGDVRDLFGCENGYYISRADPGSIAEKIIEAISYCETFPENIGGRQRIINLKLDSENISERIINIYRKLVAVQY